MRRIAYRRKKEFENVGIVIFLLSIDNFLVNALKDNKADILHLWKRISVYDDDKAFESFFYLLNMPLVKFCMMYVHQKEPAEEIVSDVFARCWINRKSLKDIKKPDTYLFVAVKNQSINYLRKYSHIHLVQIEDANELTFSGPFNPQEELEKKELIFKIEQAVEALPQQCRIIFRLIREDGIKYKEVAEILNISPRTVQTQLFRAMKKISNVLSDHVTPSYNVRSNKGLLNIVLLLSLFKLYFLHL